MQASDDREPDVFECKFCGATLVTGDRARNREHFLTLHTVDYIDQLERGGMSELDAHRRLIALTEGAAMSGGQIRR